MNAALILLLAAAAPEPGARLQASATVRIISGERISFEAWTASGVVAESSRFRQRSRIPRREGATGPSELRLVEFQ